MAYANIDFTLSERLGLKDRYEHIRRVIEHFAARRAAYRRTVDELNVLSDRDLADFGFHRSDIPRIASEAAEMV